MTFGIKASFSAGILVEDSFNRNSVLSFHRPYESPIFVSIQEGNISGVMALLRNGDASIHDVDPYGLGLLYVRDLTFHRAEVQLICDPSMLLITAGKAVALLQQCISALS